MSSTRYAAIREELHAEMARRRIDFAIISGQAEHNPSITYLLRGLKVHRPIIIVPRGERPVILYNDMERDEAERTGFRTITYRDLGAQQAANATRDLGERRFMLLSRLFDAVGVTGRLGLYAVANVRDGYFLWRRLLAARPDIELVEEPAPDLFLTLRTRKQPDELQAIRSCGQRAVGVFTSLVEFLSSLHVAEDTIVDPVGVPVTVAQIKRFIALETVRRGLLVDADTIFAPGRDGAVPHNHGRPEEPLRPGVPIVCDYFPRDADSRYCFDMTRTFCLGEADEEVRQAYELVRRAKEQAIAGIRVGRPLHELYHLVCDIFEDAGHPTLRQTPRTTEGFCHGLGHGLGLAIHEPPHIAGAPDPDLCVEPGMVFTIEPGLYYPSRGWGIRLEDVVAIRADGSVENLTPFPQRLTIPIHTR